MAETTRYAILIFLLLVFCPLANSIAPHATADSSATGRSDSDAADILLVGNSYTQGNNLVSLLSQVISANDEANTSGLTGGGMRFDQHADRMNTPGDQWNVTLQNTELDWIMLQDQSQVPGFPRTSLYWQDSLVGLTDLTTRISEIGGESVLFMTWGYREGDTTNQWRYPDYKTMQHHIRDGYIDYRDNTSSSTQNVWIAPVGLAYENLYDEIVQNGENPLDSSSTFWNLYTGDGSHPSLTGSYLTACVMYATIYGEETVGNSDGVSINAATKLMLQQIADDTVFNETSGLLTYPWMASDWGGPGDGNSTQNNETEEHLAFGATQDSTFSVDPSTALRITLNISNNAPFSDQVAIALSSSTGWNYTFSSQINITIDSDSLEWVDFTIDVPEVDDGAPLAGAGNYWSLTAQSQANGYTAWYNFSIEVKPWHEVEIVGESDSLILAPTKDGRIPVTIRNVGNIPTRASVSLQVMSGGIPDSNHPAAERIEAYGWTIALFINEMEMDWIEVGQEVTFEVGLLSPANTTGMIEIQVEVNNDWGVNRPKYTTVDGSIEWLRNGTIDHSGFDCVRIEPGQSCSGAVTVSNTGNYNDTFVIELVETPDWVSDAIQSSEVFVPTGGTSTASVFEIVINQSTASFLQGVVSYQLRLANSDIIVDDFAVNIEVAPIVSWELEILVEVDAESQNGRLATQYIVTNSGNGLDGLTVVMEVSHGVDQAIIPPEGAEYEGDLVGLHSFSQNNITVGERYTFRAWTDIPASEPENGTVWLNMTIRSTLDPEFILFHSANATFLGERFKQSLEGEESTLGIDWREIGSNVINSWNSYGYTALAIIIAALTIHQALKRRLRINEEERERKEKLERENAEEIPEDWIKKFDGSNQQEVTIPESPSVNKDDFVSDFRRVSGDPSPSAEPLSEDFVEAATVVLDHHDQERMNEDLQVVSERIEENVVTPHPANATLPESSASVTRSGGIDSKGRIGESKSVPLPTKDKETSDELDL